MPEDKDIRICPVCEREVERCEMEKTTDYHGIFVRFVCHKCYQKVMAKGYDCSTVPYEDTDDEDCMVGWDEPAW